MQSQKSAKANRNIVGDAPNVNMMDPQQQEQCLNVLDLIF